MKKYLKWIGIAFLALAVIGIFLPESETEKSAESEKEANSKSATEITHWYQGEFQDEFGDLTGDKYLFYEDSDALFSNSAANNRNLTVQVFLEKDIIWMRFDEYQDGNNETFSSYDKWYASIKFEDGTKKVELLDENPSSLEFSKTATAEILEQLIDSNTVKFRFYDNYSTQYSFEIDGFNGLNEGIEEYGW